MIITCVDTLNMAIEAANERLAGDYSINEALMAYLTEYCGVMDEMGKYCGVSGFEVEVADIGHTVAVRMDCGILTVDTPTHAFHALAERAISLSFQGIDDDTVRIEFVFPSVWNRAN